jgi:branched-chain amino acid transport system substrate-binding protein
LKLHPLGLVAGAVLALAAGSMPARAQISDNVVRIGVLNDQSSVYADTSGLGSAAAAELAAAALKNTVAGARVEIVTADHQNKVDLGSTLAQRMYDNDKVDVVVDIANSAISLAVQEIARSRGKAVLHVGSAHADLFGKGCSDTSALWLYDTYALAQGLARAIYAQGGDSWFFISADYAFGKAMEEEVGGILESLGGKVVGRVRHPVNTTDFSSYLLAAETSNAKVIALANAGGDTANAIKQAAEFQLAQRGRKFAALVFYLHTAKSIGAETAQGLQFLTGYYWDRNDASRAFARDFGAKMKGKMPSQIQAGVYSAVHHYLRAIDAARTDEARAVLRQMKAMKVDDFYAPGATLREDGRLLNDMFLAEVKSPARIKGEWDMLEILRTVPAAEIVRPLDKGNCPLVKAG